MAKFSWQSKLKARADGTLNLTQKLKCVLGRIENIIGKGDNAVCICFHFGSVQKVVDWVK